MISITRALVATLGVFGVLVAGSDSQAQPYPQSPVKIILSIPPGGLGDVVARIASQWLQTMWKVPVTVENRPGGNAAVAAQAVSRSVPDGHTLVVLPDAAFTTAPFLSSAKLPYSIEEFTPLALMVRVTPVLAVNASVPVKTVEDLVALSKSKPGSLTFGSFGLGTYPHLSMEDLKQRTGADLLHVPYRGSGPAITDLLSGQISAIVASLSTVEEHAKKGALRIIATATSKRLAAYPELPTIAESGLSNFETSAWFGLFGPANMPPVIAEKIRADMSAALDTSEAREFYRTSTTLRDDLSLAQFADVIRRDTNHWSGVIKSLGLRVD